MRWPWRRRLPTIRDRQLCITHSPGRWCEPGETWIAGDDEFVITRLVQLSPTRLRGGGSASCWQVRGVPADRV